MLDHLYMGHDARDRLVFERTLAAMFTEDLDALEEVARCRCCCDEHTWTSCPARVWNDCRGQYSEDVDEASWFRHYERVHGMTTAQFYCWGESE